MSEGIQAMWMRGGTSKGGYFRKEDLPASPAKRDQMLMSIMGSPHARQIDGLGGANPLTSKVAVVGPSGRSDVDVDFLFLQVFVDQPIVTDAQNCGNILAGVGPFAIERGFVEAQDGVTCVRIFMENTGTTAEALVKTPGGKVSYRGDTRIDGVPGTHAPVALNFNEIAGSTCGALLPTGNPVDRINGFDATLIDNGMPCVILRATDLGITGYETREALEANDALRNQVEAIRLEAGLEMNIGDVREKSVPKMTLVAGPKNGGTICTRTFIPHRCHASIGVFGATSVANAAMLPGSVAHVVADLPEGDKKTLEIEHPSGQTPVLVEPGLDGAAIKTGMLRTARKLFDGIVFL
ncbi:4-oxalomesaconate tautomerase [Hoeflea sp. TYP-13]|uniref:4-oxalomesaconate tautomerase n=1 Tax=Hoeflea sp. TYP-13 TaxID=3230023 RepID=UPI0034C6A809